MTDLYKILGLDKNATNVDIKKAYRKLSLKFHPDKNQGDIFFENMFKQIQEAYEILGTPDKKSIYDAELNNKNHSNSDRNTYNIIEPKIEYFNSNTNSFHNGSQITFNWKVLNADLIEIAPFGSVSSEGQKTFKLKNINRQLLTVTLKATNSKNGKFIYKELTLSNKEKNENQSFFTAKSFPHTMNKFQDESFWSAKGRLSRGTFFIRNIILAIILGIISTISKAGQNEDSPIVILIMAFFVIIMGIQVIKRLHDINMNGWWYLILIIPFINIIFGLFIMFYAGTKGENKYGFDPKEIEKNYR